MPSHCNICLFLATLILLECLLIIKLLDKCLAIPVMNINHGSEYMQQTITNNVAKGYSIGRLFAPETQIVSFLCFRFIGKIFWLALLR